MDCLALFEILEEFQCPVNGVGTLDSGAGENVVQWCLGGRSVGQKSPVEVEHAQKLTELTGGLWRVAVLEMGHSLFQRLRTFGGHLVTEENNLGCLKMHFTGLMMIPYL
jgi:hypothetical protein